MNKKSFLDFRLHLPEKTPKERGKSLCGTVAPQLAGNQLRKASSEIILHFSSFDDFDSWLFSVGCLLSILNSILYQIQILDVRNILIIWADDRKAHEHEKFFGNNVLCVWGKARSLRCLGKCLMKIFYINFPQHDFPPKMLPITPPPLSPPNC